MTRVKTSFIVALVLTLLPLQAIAQAPSGQQEMASEVLNKPVDLPYISLSTANAFVRGTLFRHATGGASITMHFRSKQTGSENLEYYRQVMKANRWEADAGTQNSSSIAARRNGALCQVTVLPTSRAGYGCDIMMHYRFSRDQ